MWNIVKNIDDIPKDVSEAIATYPWPRLGQSRLVPMVIEEGEHRGWYALVYFDNTPKPIACTVIPRPEVEF